MSTKDACQAVAFGMLALLVFALMRDIHALQDERRARDNQVHQWQSEAAELQDAWRQFKAENDQ